MDETTLARRLQARRWRLTTQRAAIASALDQARGHVSADDVHAAARADGTRLSLATVYNTLTALVAMGELREVHPGRGPVLFDVNASPHHHLVCDTCGRLVDVDRSLADCVRLPDGIEPGFEVRDVDVVFHGRCAACARR